jgi:uncharacterized protein YbbC (DUF1343 family)
LNELKLAGVKFEAVKFTPESSKCKGELCGGVRVVVTDREAMDTAVVGSICAWMLHRNYPEFQYEKVEWIMQNSRVAKALEKLDDPREAKKLWEGEVKEWMRVRGKYLMYPD